MESLQSVDNEEITLNQDELKAHDKITLRREARRRKILENAKNRLERLNGRTGSTNVENVTTNEAIPERYGHMHWLGEYIFLHTYVHVISMYVCAYFICVLCTPVQT